MIKDTQGNVRFFGIYRGIVADNQDPLGKGRLRLQVPQVLSSEITGWAWSTYPPGLDSSLPEIGAGVFVMFEGGDPSFPVCLGLFNELPPVSSTFAVVGGSSGTQPTFSSDPLFSGSYTRHGDKVHFQIQVDMDNITSFGTGQYYMDLPFPSKYSYQFSSGCLHDVSTGTEYPIFAHVTAGQSRMYLQSIDAQGNTAYQVDFTYNHPVTLTTEDNYHVYGDYIAVE